MSWVRAVGLALLIIVSGCAQKKRLTLEVKDGSLGVRGAEVYEAGTRTRLGTTAPGGRVTLIVAPKHGTKLRLEVREPSDRMRYRYEGPIEIDDARLKAGMLLVRAFPLDADSLSLEGKAELTLVSVPAGADVLIDDEPAGKTPLTLSDLTPRRLRVELRLSGYHPVKEELVLQAEALTKTDSLIPIEVTTASLSVSSDPSGGDIFLDGVATGRVTPAELKDLSAGRHRIRIEKKGYQPYESTAQLREGGSSLTRALLDPVGSRDGVADATNRGSQTSGGRTGGDSSPRIDPRVTGGTTKADNASVGSATGPTQRYRISPAPGWAEVTVDGKAVNPEQKRFFFLELSPGKHVFRLVNAEAGIDVVLPYEVPRGDTKKNLILDYERGEVRSRP